MNLLPVSEDEVKKRYKCTPPTKATCACPAPILPVAWMFTGVSEDVPGGGEGGRDAPQIRGGASHR